MKATIARIADTADVSIATVDRVLNNRSGVKERTRQAVMQAARTLGYFGPDEQQAQRTRIHLILPAGDNSFMHLLRQDLISELESCRDVDGRVHQVERFDENALTDKLAELRGNADAIGLVAIDHPTVSEAIETLTADGVKVATMVSDVPSARTVGYVGVDNRAAGRLAGYLIGRLLPRETPAKVAIFIGSSLYRGHDEREMGIRSILSREFRHLSISAIQEIQDDREQAFKMAKKLLSSDLPQAIYNVGSGNQGIARALRELGLEKEIIFVGHDLTSATRAMLLDETMDAVIDQNARVQAREIVKLLLSAVQGASQPEYPPRLQVIFRENLP